jgi:hypothetical protein
VGPGEYGCERLLERHVVRLGARPADVVAEQFRARSVLRRQRLAVLAPTGAVLVASAVAQEPEASVAVEGAARASGFPPARQRSPC